MFEPCAKRLDLILVERPLDLAVGEHALLDLEAQRPLDQRHVLAEEQVVGVGPVDAADLVDVAKALGDEERSLRARSLEDGVDRDRRAVQEQAGRAIIAAGLLDALVDAVDQPLRGRQGLAEGERAGTIVEHCNIGEGAADVGGEADVGTGLCADCLFHWTEFDRPTTSWPGLSRPSTSLRINEARRGCPRRKIYAACASLAASAGMTEY